MREFREKCEQDEKDLVAMMLAEIPVATEALEATGHWDPEENAFHWLEATIPSLQDNGGQVGGTEQPMPSRS